MKKKILLSVFSVFSLMIASKSFAQRYHTTYIKVEDNRRYEARRANEIRRDHENINYTLQLIDQKKAELQRDRAYHNRFAYRQDKQQLADLYATLNVQQNKLEADMRGGYRDGRVASTYGRRF